MKLRERPPVIGITGYRNQTNQGIAIRQTYIDSVLRAGGLPVILPMFSEEKTVNDLLDRLDGLIISGGGDVNPATYGAERIPECGESDDLRDRSELLLIHGARARKMPIFGICRGVQILNVAYGGSLIQDIPSHYDIPKEQHSQAEPYTMLVHDVELVCGGLLNRITGLTHFMTNSMHHQAVAVPGGSLVVDALCDGIVEAVHDRENEEVFGVQFHPEFFSGEHDYAQKLFDYFADAAEKHCNKKQK